jgi:hypothetical protein
MGTRDELGNYLHLSQQKFTNPETIYLLPSMESTTNRGQNSITSLIVAHRVMGAALGDTAAVDHK